MEYFMRGVGTDDSVGFAPVHSLSQRFKPGLLIGVCLYRRFQLLDIIVHNVSLLTYRFTAETQSSQRLKMNKSYEDPCHFQFYEFFIGHTQELRADIGRVLSHAG